MIFTCGYLPNTAYLSEITTRGPPTLPPIISLSILNLISSLLLSILLLLLISYPPVSYSSSRLSHLDRSSLLPYRLACVCLHTLVSRPYPLPLHVFGPTHTPSDWLLVLSCLTPWGLLTSCASPLHPCISRRNSTRALHLVKAEAL